VIGVGEMGQGCLGDALVAELLEGALDEAACGRALAHLDACEECRALVGAAGRDEPPAAGAGAIARGVGLGRYLVLERIGAGAMGVVYAAFDSQLDRKVAIKVLRDAGESGARALERRAELEREAKVMAKLSHPNVVAVYDVGEHEGRLFVAMEFAGGGTLREYLRGREPSWQDVVSLFVQAGEGLEAAHDAGVVHRDFKPENVLVGVDERPRVTDFGLAHAGGAAEGERAGTPAYMAPEQLDQGRADARSDVYAFSVALYEALYGVRPFPDGDVGARRDETIAAAPAGSQVPAWVRRVVLRGLRASPEERWPSMRAMLSALDRAPRPVGRVALIVGALLAGAVVLGWRALRHDGAARCSGAEVAFGQAWGGEGRAAALAALEGAGERGRFAAAGVDRELDAYRARWIEAHGETCRATRERGEQSEQLLDARMRCLELQRVGVQELGRQLAGGGDKVVDGAIAAAQGLPQPSACRAATMTGVAPLPADAAARERLRQAAATVAEARPFEYLTPAKDAAERLRGALGEARALGDGRLEAEASIALGTAVALGGDQNGAREILLSAVGPALRLNDNATLASAWVRLAWLDVGAGYPRSVEAWSAQAEAALAAFGGDDALDGERMVMLGASWIYGYERSDEAKALVTRAREAFVRARGPDYFRIATCDDLLGNALFFEARWDEAIEVHSRSLALRERVFGPDHPVCETSRGNIAEDRLGKGEPNDAIAIFTRWIDRSRREQAVSCFALHRRAEAFRHARRFEEAAADDRACVEAAGDSPDLFWGLVGLGEDLLALERPAEALAPLERALALELKVSQAQLGRGEVALATALVRLGTDAPRARLVAGRAQRRLEPLAKSYGDWYQVLYDRAVRLAG
jgi:tetratricopeptide (TPR) repeat protein